MSSFQDFNVVFYFKLIKGASTLLHLSLFSLRLLRFSNTDSTARALSPTARSLLPSAAEWTEASSSAAMKRWAGDYLDMPAGANWTFASNKVIEGAYGVVAVVVGGIGRGDNGL
jgi:hypothetical protein